MPEPQFCWPSFVESRVPTTVQIDEAQPRGRYPIGWRPYVSQQFPVCSWCGGKGKVSLDMHSFGGRESPRQALGEHASLQLGRNLVLPVAAERHGEFTA